MIEPSTSPDDEYPMLCNARSGRIIIPHMKSKVASIAQKLATKFGRRWPSLAEIGPLRSNTGQIWSKSSHHWSTIGPQLVEIGPNFAHKHRPKLVVVGQHWPNLGQFWPTLANCWSNSRIQSLALARQHLARSPALSARRPQRTCARFGAAPAPPQPL